MLVHDVRKFVQTIPTNHLVKVHIFNIDDMCEDLNVASVPLSHLIVELLQKYPETMLRLHVDEFDGEQLNLEAATELRETLQRKELEDSYISLLPHSLSRNRTYVLKGKKQPHGNYRYEETGMKLFQLDKCMRTTENIFKLTKAIEKKICKENTIIYQPKQLKSKLSQLTESNADTSHEVVQHLNNPRTLTTNVTEKEGNTTPQESSSINTNEHPDYKDFQSSINSNISRKSFLERPLDLEVIAANAARVTVHKSKRTVTQYAYPKASSVGHNIKGSIPKYITIAKQKVISTQTLCDLISKLAIIMQKCFSKNSIRRLVLCNTEFHYFVIKNLLKILKVDFVEYIDFSDWKPKGTNGEVASLSQKCILTNYAESRGNEADQVIVVVDPADSNLKHLALECMTRCQDELLIIGIKEPFKSKKKCFLRVNLKQIKSKYTMGKILEKLKNGGLIECNHWSGISLGDEDKCIVDKKFQINVTSKTYKEYLSVLKENEVTFEGSSHNINIDATALKQLHITDPVKNLKCSYKNESECLLDWTAEGFTYIVRATKIGNNSVWYEVFRTRQSNCTIKNLKQFSSYIFSVAALSNMDKSDNKEIHYFHVE